MQYGKHWLTTTCLFGMDTFFTQIYEEDSSPEAVKEFDTNIENRQT